MQLLFFLDDFYFLLKSSEMHFLYFVSAFPSAEDLLDFDCFSRDKFVDSVVLLEPLLVPSLLYLNSCHLFLFLLKGVVGCSFLASGSLLFAHLNRLFR